MPIFCKQLFIKMLNQAETNIEKEHKNLSKLDSVTGDGDHGITINRTMKAVGEALEEGVEKPFSDLMRAVAMKVMMCDGGSTSPLMGSYFMGLANGAVSDELDAGQTANFFQAGYDNFKKTSKAEPGDKTMIDALSPATEAIVATLSEGDDLSSAFSLAAEASEEGAEKTKEYVAKYGRARTMGERAIGHIDPGAVSIGIIFRSFAEAVK